MIDKLRDIAVKCKFQLPEFCFRDGWNVNMQDENGDTLLHIVASRNQTGFLVAKFLLENCLDVNIGLKNEDGLTPLGVILKSKAYNIFNVLLEHRVEEIRKMRRDVNESVASYLANEGGNDSEEVARFFKSQDGDGIAFLDAVSKGYCSVVSQALICEFVGTSPILATKALDITYDKRLSSMAKTLIEGGVDAAFHVLNGAIDNNLDKLKFFLEAGADVNLTSSGGITPLIAAAQEGHLEVVEFLLAKNANVNLAPNSGLTPLFIAAGNGNLELARLLLAKNANVNLASNSDLTPLFAAAGNGNLELVRLLLANDANVDLARNNGETLLITAVNEGNLELVRLLLAKNANVNQASIDGTTPLLIAVIKGNLELVRLLLAKNANVNLASIDGVALLSIAAHKRHVEIVAKLISAICEQYWGSLEFIAPKLVEAVLAAPNIGGNFDALIAGICRSSEPCAALALDVILCANLGNVAVVGRIVGVINGVPDSVEEVAAGVAQADAAEAQAKPMSRAVKNWVNNAATVVNERSAVPLNLREGVKNLVAFREKLSTEIDTLSKGGQRARMVTFKGNIEEFAFGVAKHLYCKMMEEGPVHEIYKNVAVNFATLILNSEGDFAKIEDVVRNALPEFVNKVGAIPEIHEDALSVILKRSAAKAVVEAVHDSTLFDFGGFDAGGVSLKCPPGARKRIAKNVKSVADHLRRELAIVTLDSVVTKEGALGLHSRFKKAPEATEEFPSQSGSDPLSPPAGEALAGEAPPRREPSAAPAADGGDPLSSPVTARSSP